MLLKFMKTDQDQQNGNNKVRQQVNMRERMCLREDRKDLKR